MPQQTQTVRPPAVAGAFYPAGADTLRAEIDGYLADAKPKALRPKALLVPHAGYVYSGPVAASAYALLRDLRPRPTRVVLLGPSHHVAFHGLALPDVDALRTPLGVVPVDPQGARLAAAFDCVQASQAVHAREHSLEVQLPFLQRALGDFTLVPLAVGRASPEQVADVLAALWGGDETVIVVSSDLSHYLPYEQAVWTDKATAQRIVALNAEGLDGEQACGAYPVCGLLLAARRRGLVAHLLDLRNSGDTAGDRSRVVGYGAFAFTQEAARH